MKISVPVYDDAGQVKFEATLSEGEIQEVLKFGLNYLIATGLLANMGVKLRSVEEDELQEELPLQ